MKNAFCLKIFALLFLIGGIAAAQAAGDPAALFAQGRTLYASGQYAAAAELLERAANSDRRDSEYRHWLGKAYGRMAEEASWFEALSLAKKTRKALEQAVSLDPENTAAISDLISFYHDAPTFLGGGEDKARALEQRLAGLEGHDSGARND